ncbi:MAG: TfoX/Sxy family protein [Bacteroidetes bacterium]|nr:TfoX/Sxy family protein [Bacteroidota bacterium]
MSSDQGFIEFVTDQIESAGTITSKKMFGEYAVYCDGKVVALVCDNKLFVKPTESGRKFIGVVTEAPAYPGAKPAFLIEDQLDDREWISNLIKITCSELPEPVIRKKKKDRG